MKYHQFIIRIFENKFAFSFLFFFLFLLIAILAMSLTGVDVDHNEITFHSNKEIIFTLRLGAAFAFIMIIIIFVIVIKEYYSKKVSTIRNIKKFKNKKFSSIQMLIDSYVHDTSLDYLAYYKKGLHTERYNPHIRDELKANNIKNNVNKQLEEYNKVGESLFKTIDDLNQNIKGLKQRVLIRVILDVEKGGIFYYHIDDDTSSYLIGATVNQDNMEDYSADQIMRDVSEKIKNFN